MYQSLYRTWRPRTFSDMVGQEHVVRTLKQQVATGHISHAYLFSGSRGTGKTSAARILSMAINCQKPQAGDPCLACEACQSLMAESTLDVFEMDAASNSRVEEIREMLEKVNYPPQFVRHKVYIIDEVHMLSNAAFNALLKTLEEPPGYMVFILATTEPQKLPATILSRCQRFDFGRLREEAMMARLKQALKPDQQAEEAALQLIASAAEGSMRDAWSLMDMCLSAGGDLSEAAVREALGAVDSGFMFDFVSALAQQDAATAYQMIGQLMRSGKDIQVFFKDLSLHLRRLLAASLDAQAVSSLSPERRQLLKAQAKAIPLSQLVWMLEKAVQAEGNLRWASQQRTVLEVFALSLCELSEETEPLALMARIAQLEQNIAQGIPAVPAKATEEVSLPAAEEEVAPAVAPEYSAEPEMRPQPAEPDKAPPAMDAEPPAAMTAPPPAEPEPAREEAPSQGSAPEVGLPANPQPPAVAPAAAPEPAMAQQSPKQVWNSMLEKAKQELSSVYNMMNEGKFGGYSDGCYVLTYPQDKLFLIDLMMAPERRQIIEKLLSQAQGSEARFEARGESTKPQQMSARQKAQDDIQALSDLFGRQNIIVQGGEG